MGITAWSVLFTEVAQTQQQLVRSTSSLPLLQPKSQKQSLGILRPTFISYLYTPGKGQQENLGFFLRQGLIPNHDSYHFVVTVSGTVPEPLHDALRNVEYAASNVEIIYRQADPKYYCAHAELFNRPINHKSGIRQKNGTSIRRADIDAFDFFILLSSSSRGPFIPTWYTMPWPTMLTGMLGQNNVHLFGSSINCMLHPRQCSNASASPHDALQNLHVQGLYYAMSMEDARNVFANNSRWCNLPTSGLRDQAELMITSRFLRAGHNVAVSHTFWRGVNFLKHDTLIRQCCHAKRCWSEPKEGCDDTIFPRGPPEVEVHPLEMIFYLTGRNVMNHVLDKYSRWQMYFRPSSFNQMFWDSPNMSAAFLWPDPPLSKPFPMIDEGKYINAPGLNNHMLKNVPGRKTAAVCLFGVIARSLVHTWPKILAHILLPIQEQGFNIKLYAFNVNVGSATVDGVNIDKEAVHGILPAGTVFEQELQTNIDKWVDKLCDSVVKVHNLTCKLQYDLGMGSHSETVNAFRQMYAESKVANWLRLQADNVDVALALSPDLYFFHDINGSDVLDASNAQRNSDFMYVTRMNDYDGYTNGFYMGSAKVLARVMSRLHEYHLYAAMKCAYERILMKAMEHSKIVRKITPLIFVKVRASGSVFIPPAFPTSMYTVIPKFSKVD